MKHLAAALAVASALCAAPHATAASASAQFTDIRLELIDLDAADGLAPTATWLPDTLLSFHVGAGRFWDPWNSVTAGGSAASTAELPWERHVTHLGAQADAIVAQDRISLSGATLPASTTEFAALAWGGTGVEFDFVLGPGTGVKISGNLSLFAGIDSPACLAPERTCESAQSLFHLATFDGMGHWNEVYRIAQARADGPQSASVSEFISFEMLNPQATELRIPLNFFMEALGNSAAPIPEPQTWALFCVGLLGMGAVARRGGRIDVGRRPA
jgi:hypothetical protein